jgi:hypothetical protein
LRASTLGPPARGHARDGVHDLHVQSDQRFHARTQYFDDHLAAVLQARGVDLGDRCSGERYLVEVAQLLFEYRAIGFLDRGACHGAGEWRYVVLQFGQFIGNIFGQQIAPGR